VWVARAGKLVKILRVAGKGALETQMVPNEHAGRKSVDNPEPPLTNESNSGGGMAACEVRAHGTLWGGDARVGDVSK